MLKYRQSILQILLTVPSLYILSNEISKQNTFHKDTLICQNLTHILSAIIGMKIIMTNIWNIFAPDSQKSFCKITKNCLDKVLLIFYWVVLIYLSQQESFIVSVTTQQKICMDCIYAVLILKVNKNNMAHYRKKIMENGYGLQQSYRRLVFQSAINLILFCSYLTISLRNQSYLYMTLMFNLLIYNFFQQEEYAVQRFNSVWLLLWLSPFTMLIGCYFVERNNTKKTQLVSSVEYLSSAVCLFLLKLFVSKGINTWNIIKNITENQKTKNKMQYERQLKVLQFEAIYRQQHQKSQAKEQQHSQCSICSLQMTQSTIKLKCSHKFHYNCLKVWLKLNFSCPICRKIDII